MIEVVDGLLAVVAGAAGGVSYRAAALIAARRRPTVGLAEASPGAVVCEEGGRRWTVVSRRIDRAYGEPARLTVDLVEETS